MCKKLKLIFFVPVGCHPTHPENPRNFTKFHEIPRNLYIKEDQASTSHLIPE